jgi:hypothetical protein
MERRHPSEFALVRSLSKTCGSLPNDSSVCSEKWTWPEIAGIVVEAVPEHRPLNIAWANTRNYGSYESHS